MSSNTPANRTGEAKWTPEPWNIDQYGNVRAESATRQGISHRAGVVVANGFASELGRSDPNSPGELNRERIVQCINACQGIENPAALPALVEAVDSAMTAIDSNLFSTTHIEALRTALTALKGQP